MIFKKLGIHGFTPAQERAILSGILSGEPTLLIGPPGVAKTELVKAIGAALREDSKRLNPNDSSNWFNYQIYDASKLNFEDLVGYPNINALQKDPPSVEYIPSPSSIWNKHLIAFDELNRCAEDRQSNLFEIIRSRKLHGTPTNNLFIFSTINPFGDVGTLEMSNALVDRHTFYLRLDKFEDMESIERKKVIQRVGDVDGIGFTYWGNSSSMYQTSDDTVNDTLADVGQEIRETLVNAARHYEELKKTQQQPVTNIIDKLISTFKEAFTNEDASVRKECTISGRRAASVYRAVLANRAMEIALAKDSKEISPFAESMINTVTLCLPIGISGALKQDIVDKANKVVQNTIRALWPTIKSNKNTVDTDKIAEAMSTKNPIRILDIVTSVNMNEETKKAIFSRLIDKENYKDSKGNISISEYYAIQTLLYKLNKEIPGYLPSHIKLEVTLQQMEQASGEQGIDIPSRYAPILSAISEDKKDNPLLYFALKWSYIYYSKEIETDDQVIKAILDSQSLCDSIEAALTYHKQNTLKDDSNSTDTEKKITEKAY